MALQPKWREILAAAIPVKAGCFQCDKTWGGTTCRFEAYEHASKTKHAIWIESIPAQG